MLKKGLTCKDFILPLIFYKRLWDVFDDEYEKCAQKFCGGELARYFIEADHQDALKNNRKHPGEESKAPRLFGQELNPTTFALAKMNMFLQDFTDTQIEIGDTFRQPKFTVDKKLMRFDYVVANPMWNQDNYGADAYEADSFERFQDGIASKSSADWGWVQHIWASSR